MSGIALNITAALVGYAIGLLFTALAATSELAERRREIERLKAEGEVLQAKAEQMERERDEAQRLEAKAREEAFRLLGEKWSRRVEREAEWPPYIEVRD